MTLTKRYILFGTLLAAAALATVAIARDHTRRASAPDPVTLPEQTPIYVTLDRTLSSNGSRAGDHFQATVAHPIVIGDRVVIPQGVGVEGMVVRAQKSGHLKGRARLQLTLQSVDLRGERYPITTATYYNRGKGHRNRNWGWIGGGGGGGVLIGALAAGGKGALIGGPIGAGAGTAVAYFTGKKNIRLPAETTLKFTLAQPVTIQARS